MSKALLTALALLMLGPVAPLGAAAGDLSPLDKDPYDYRARKRLVETCQKRGDHVSAYYHAAWLAWLAPRRYAESAAGQKLLRDRQARDRAGAWQTTGPMPVIVGAVEANQLLASTCLNGATAQQAGRVGEEIAKLLTAAEQAAATVTYADAVSRMALARLNLALDDCLRLEGSESSRRARSQALKRAASLGTTVAVWLPKSPGAHHTLAIARARLADLESRSDLWELAVYEAETAQALDPEDQGLTEMVWILHLRAGHWAEAKRWQTGGPPRPPGQRAAGKVGKADRAKEEIRRGQRTP